MQGQNRILASLESKLFNVQKKYPPKLEFISYHVTYLLR